MPRFTIDSAPIPARRFVLPEGERSTAPAPLPELGKVVTAPVWGEGVAKRTYSYKRTKAPAEAQTAKRTPSRPSEAQMAAGGYTVGAPVGARKGRRVLEFTAASDRPMVAFLGTIQLRIDRESVDLSRLELGLLSLAIDHNTSELMGRITEGTVYPGRLDMEAEISNTPTATLRHERDRRP